jgi:hypothetical protein
MLKGVSLLKMKNIDNIRKKIGTIENLLQQIKSELDVISIEKPPQKKTVLKEEDLSDELLKERYEKLYEKFTSGLNPEIADFIKSKSKKYLSSFCRANNVPVDANKKSKEFILNEVLQWFAQRKAITKKAT